MYMSEFVFGYGNHTYFHGDSKIVIAALASALLMSELYPGLFTGNDRTWVGSGGFHNLASQVGSGPIITPFNRPGQVESEQGVSKSLG